MGRRRASGRPEEPRGRGDAFRVIASVGIIAVLGRCRDASLCAWEGAEQERRHKKGEALPR